MARTKEKEEAERGELAEKFTKSTGRGFETQKRREERRKEHLSREQKKAEEN